MWPFQIRLVCFLSLQDFVFEALTALEYIFMLTPEDARHEHNLFTVCSRWPSDSYSLLLDIDDPELYDHLSGTAEKRFLHQKRGDSFTLR